MKGAVYRKDQKILNDFVNESINGATLKNRLNKEEDLYEIIRIWFASLPDWKKTSKLGRLKDRLIFLYRRSKQRKRQKEIRPSPNLGSIVFFPISETQVILFEPIIKRLTEKNENSYILRFDNALDGVKKEIDKRKLPYQNFEHYLSKEVVKQSKQKMRKFRSFLKLALKVSKRKKEYSRLVSGLHYYFGPRKRMYELIELLEGTKNFIEKAKPSAIILPDENWDIFRAVSYICRKKNIPCIVMQHGTIDAEGLEDKKTFADKKILFGDIAKEIIVQKGFPKEKIAITGSPLYDVFKKKSLSESEKNSIKNSLGIKDEKIILFATYADDLKLAEKRLRILFKISKIIPNLKIIIKQHPAEYSDKRYERFYKKIMKQYNINAILSKDDMWKMLSISDIFFADFTTSILEAYILKKPMILANFENAFTYRNYPEIPGFAWHAYNFEDVLSAAKYILTHKVNKGHEDFISKLIYQNLYKNDGNATERVIKVINKEINKKRK